MFTPTGPSATQRPPDPRTASFDHFVRELREIKDSVTGLVRTVGCLPVMEASLRTVREQLGKRTKSHLTVEEVADLTGRAAYTIRRWIKEKRLKAERIKGGGPKGRLLIPREELEQLIAGGLGSEVPDAVLA
jgi:excisionase family DNA binding protein